MKKINEGNLYNVETSEPKKDRSSELDSVTKIMMDQFWEAMGRQGVTPEKAKMIAKQTFASDINT
jgi:hypothetical protein